MRCLRVIVLVLAVIGPIPSAASSTAQPGFTIHLTQGAGIASIPVQRTEMYFVGGPAAVIAPFGTPEGSKPELTFAIRAWRDGEKARVAVYAQLADKRAPTGRTETPIATFRLARGQNVEVKEATAWGARGLVVSADSR